MSGILQNLIARHQGRAMTVEPRQRTLFEPDAGAIERPAVSETVATESYRPDAEIARNTSAVMPTPSVPAFSLPAEHSPKIKPIERQTLMPMPDHGFPELESRLQDILARMTAARPDAPATVQDSGIANAEIPDVERLEAMIDRLAKQTPKTVPTASVEDAAKTTPVPPAVLMPSETLPVRPDRRDVENANSDAPAHIQPPAPLSTPSETGALQIPAWLLALQAQLGRQTENASGQSAEEPIINVTIGRIDIRAGKTDAATSAPTPRLPSGILSLDDYLKQRNTRSRP